jgi:C1A family cysteine protease
MNVPIILNFSKEEILLIRHRFRQKNVRNITSQFSIVKIKKITSVSRKKNISKCVTYFPSQSSAEISDSVMDEA